MPNSLSRKVIGSIVPHFISIRSAMLTNMTSARKGEVPPNGRLMRLASSGMLAVESVCRPGPNTSSALPSRKNTAVWLSRTTSCDPTLNSPDPPSGTRCIICRPVGSRNSITSKIAM